MEETITSAESESPARRKDFIAVFDLGQTTGRSEIRRKLRRAYRASREGPVGLILGPHEVHLIDRLLDPIVEELGPAVEGVVYLESESK